MMFFQNQKGNPQHISIMIILVFSVVGGAVLLYATMPWGIGLSPDSVAYIRASRGLLTGEGLNTTHFAPLYPILLAAGGMLGVDPLHIARWLQAIFFGANIFLGGMLIYSLLADLVWPAIAGSFLLLVSIPMLTIHVMAWTEPVFIFFGFAGWALLAFYLRNARVGVLIISAILFSLAFLTRYAGAALILAGCLGILLFSRRIFYKRLLEIGVFGFISSAPMGLWMLRNRVMFGTATSRDIVFHPINRSHFWQAVFTFSRWLLLPDTVSNVFRFGLGAITFLGLVIIMVFGYRKRQSFLRETNLTDVTGMPYIIKLLSLFIMVYGMFLVMSISFLDANTPLDDRILSPIFVAGVVLLLYFVGEAVRVFKPAPLVRIVLVSSLMVFSVFYVITGLRLVADSHNEGLGFSNVTWHDSEILAQVNQLSEDMTVITNLPEAVYIYTGRLAVPLPRRMKAVTRQANQNYSSELAGIEDKMVNEEGVIVYFSGSLKQEAQRVIEEIDQDLSLCVLAQGNDGVIYGAAVCH